LRSCILTKAWSFISPSGNPDFLSLLSPCELPFFHLTFFHFAMVDGKDDPQQGIEATPAEGIEVVHNQDRKVDMGEYENKQDISHVEKVLSESDDLVKDNMDITRVDKEIQAYAAHSQVDIDEETNKRLKKLIDRRILVVMICTYFLQALDKGTMSFAAIMGIKDDAHLNGGQKVCKHLLCFLLHQHTKPIPIDSTPG
jgi:hypothetical protein